MTTKKPKPTAIESTVTSLSSDRTAGLSEMFADLELPPDIQGEIVNMARQLSDRNGKITAGDQSQLRDLARAMLRAKHAWDLIKLCHAAGDTTTWLKVNVSLEKSSTTIRGLMRDLRLTQSTSTTEGAPERKARLKAGSSWEGVL